MGIEVYTIESLGSAEFGTLNTGDYRLGHLPGIKVRILTPGTADFTEILAVFTVGSWLY